MVIEGEVGGDEIETAHVGFLMADSGGGDLGIGKDDGSPCIEIDAFGGAAEGVAGGDFALEDGDVNNFERPANIAGGVDTRIGSLLKIVDTNLAGRLQVDIGLFEAEASDGGAAAEGIEDMLGVHLMGAVVVVEVNAKAIVFPGELFEPGPGIEVDPLALEDPHHDLGGLL